MRQLVALLVACIPTLACGGKAAQTLDPNTAALVKAFVAAWNDQGVDAIDSLVTADVVLDDLAIGEKTSGPRELKAFMKGAFADIPDYRWVMTKVFAQGESVATEWVFSGTMTTPALVGDGRPVTGKKFSVRGAGMYQLDRGKFTRYTDYYNQLEIVRQVRADSAAADQSPPSRN